MAGAFDILANEVGPYTLIVEWINGEQVPRWFLEPATGRWFQVVDGRPGPELEPEVAAEVEGMFQP